MDSNAWAGPKGIKMGHYSGVDVALGVLAFYWIARGFWVGFSGEIFSLSGMIVGFFLAFKGAPVVAAWILAQPWAPGVGEGLLSLVCGFLLFILCNFAASLVCRVARKGIKAVNLGGLDRVMGAAAGGMKAVVLILFFYGATHVVFGANPPAWVRASRFLESAGNHWPEMSKKLSEWKLLDLGVSQSSSGEEKP